MHDSYLAFFCRFKGYFYFGNNAHPTTLTLTLTLHGQSDFVAVIAECRAQAGLLAKLLIKSF